MAARSSTRVGVALGRGDADHPTGPTRTPALRREHDRASPVGDWSKGPAHRAVPWQRQQICPLDDPIRARRGGRGL